MKHKIFLVISLAVLVLAVGIFSWTYKKGNLQIGAVPMPSASGYGARVAGYTKFTDGTVARKASVLLYKINKTDSSGNTVISRTTADDSGHYQFNINMYPEYYNDYYVYAHKQRNEWHADAKSSNFTLYISNNKRIDLILFANYMILRGNVTDRYGQAIPEFNVIEEFTDDKFSALTYPGYDGFYLIKLWPGVGSVHVTAMGYKPSSSFQIDTFIPETTIVKDFVLDENPVDV